MTASWRRLQEMTGAQFPVMQDGMGPQPCTLLAAAVSEAGGLGTLSSPSIVNTSETFLRENLRAVAEKVAASTDRPFGVNVPVGRLANGELLPVSRLCIDEAIRMKRDGGKVGEQLSWLVTSAGFAGELGNGIREAGLVHMHKVGSLTHALKAAKSGVDVVIAAGYEMGGHTHAQGVHTMVLAPQVIAALDIPVIVAGGICDGRGLAAALAMGGAAVAMGTRFIATRDHEWHENYKQRIVDAPEWGDIVFPGVYAPIRGLRNAAQAQMEELRPTMTPEEFIVWEEEQIRVSQREGDVENGILVAGQIAAAIHDLPTVAEVIERVVTQAEELLAASATFRLRPS